MKIVLADTGGNYVAAAYVVFLALVLIYVAIMAFKLTRLERDVAALDEIQARRTSDGELEDAETLDADAGLEAPRR